MKILKALDIYKYDLLSSLAESPKAKSSDEIDRCLKPVLVARAIMLGVFEYERVVQISCECKLQSTNTLTQRILSGLEELRCNITNKDFFCGWASIEKDIQTLKGSNLSLLLNVLKRKAERNIVANNDRSVNFNFMNGRDVAIELSIELLIPILQNKNTLH